jgi:uncharacterized protein (DUF1810 family)
VSVSDDAGGLERFVRAQDHHDAYQVALAEIAAGLKRSHWMWFVVPQLAGLGASATSRLYGIATLEEARSYLDHEVLGPRLREVARAVLLHAGEDMSTIFGPLDAMKLRSSMTLFARAAPDEPLFADVVGRCLGSRYDERTDELLRKSRGR